jgi:hypothetical protein
MLYVKAVQQDGDYSLYETQSVVVRESTADGVNGPGMPPFVKAQRDVYLYSGELVPADRILSVGHGPGHYRFIYVMNERGKTIDTVQAETRPVAEPRLQRFGDTYTVTGSAA